MIRQVTPPLIALLALLVAACAPSSPANDRELPTYVIAPPTLTAMASQPGSPDTTPIAAAEMAQSVPEVAVLLPWVAMPGTLADGQVAQWQFDGTAGEQIRIGAISREAELMLNLLGTDGRLMVSGEVIETSLPEAGAYTVIVEAIEGEGAYEIGLSYPGQQNPNEQQPTALALVVGVPSPLPAYADLGSYMGTLEHNITVGEQMTENSPSHVYTFTGQAGRYVEIEMRRVMGMIDPLLTLYNSDGLPVAMDDDTAGEQGAILRNVRLAADGIYTVTANGSGLAGGYSLRLLQYDTVVQAPVTLEAILTPTPIPTYNVPTPAPMSPGNRLEDHAVIQSNLPPSGVIVHPFYAAAGETITIGVTPFGGIGFMPEFDLVDPDGEVLLTARSSESNAMGDAVAGPIQVQLDGTYQIFLRGENGTSGDYFISYGSGRSRQEILRGQAVFDQTINSAIDRRGLHDSWIVRLTRGDIITVSINPGPGSELDPVVEVVPASDPSIVLASDDNSGGGRSAYLREVVANETGFFLIRVYGKDAQSQGAYSLIWRYINVASTATPPPARSPILTTQGSVADNAYSFFPFYGQAGQRVHIRVIGLGEFDPVAALVGPDGTELAQSDDIEGDLNPRIIHTLPADGTYNLRVNGYLSGGSFEVVVEVLY